MSLPVDDPRESELVTCPACTRESFWQISLLGYMGSHLHYRCRYCGWVWSEALDEVIEIRKHNGG